MSAQKRITYFLEKYLVFCVLLFSISGKLFADDFAALPECTTRSVPNVLFSPTTFSISEPINVCAGSDIVITATGGDDLDLAVCGFCAPDRCAADPRGPNSCLFALNSDKKVIWLVWGDSSSYVVGYYGSYNQNCIIRTPSEPGDTCHVLAYRMEATTAYDGGSNGDYDTFNVVAPPYEDYTITAHESLFVNINDWVEKFSDATQVFLKDDENENINQNQDIKYNDIHCCTGIRLGLLPVMNTFEDISVYIGPEGFFPIDGLDIIEDMGEQFAIFSIGENVKLVDEIDYCDGPVTNCGGCTRTGIDNMVIDANYPSGIAQTIAHEYGHTAGLYHVGKAGQACIPVAHARNFLQSICLGDQNTYLLPCQCEALILHR